MGIATFKNSPTSRSIQHFLERAMDNAGANPKYITCDKGQQFWCGVFKDWCDGQGITPRFGAVGQHGSIALIERFVLTLKNECMRSILVPLRTDAFHQELMCFTDWYNRSRPHSSLNGKTPHEVYHGVLPACQRPRLEPRAMAARCAMRIAARTGRRPLWRPHSP
jgi:hypothetical protein